MNTYLMYDMTSDKNLIYRKDMDPQHRLMLEIVYEALESGMYLGIEVPLASKVLTLILSRRSSRKCCRD
jgi:hypothetical protein